MRNVADAMGKNAKTIEPLVPVDLVVDHSVMVDHYGTKDALDLNMKLEFQRNRERYEFMKWGMQAFDTFGVVPPGFGIVHQINLEYLARGVYKKDGIYYPDTLVGTDSHTTMINGIGVVGWGVGGIEAEAGMLGQPVYFLTPDVVGVHLKGKLREGVTATDLVLSITELLRKAKVVGKFVEFFGEGTASLAVPDRATIGNMAPEYGATMGFFPVDEKTISYFEGTGRTHDELAAFEAYFRAQGLFGIPKAGAIDYSSVVSLDLGTVAPSLAGPKRPQDRIEIGNVKREFTRLFSAPVLENGFNQPASASGAAVHARLRRRRARGLRTGDSRRRAARCRGDEGQSAAGAARSGTRARWCRDRRRRRVDRRDHVVHQHQQSRRAAGSGPAREKSSRGWLDGAASTSRRHWHRARASSPTICRRPACCPISKSSASRWRPTAARRVSATPVIYRPRSTKRSSATIWYAPPCCRATATSKRAFIRI